MQLVSVCMEVGLGRGSLICTYGNAFSHCAAFSVVARWNKRAPRSCEGKHIKKRERGEGGESNRGVDRVGREKEKEDEEEAK